VKAAGRGGGCGMSEFDSPVQYFIPIGFPRSRIPAIWGLFSRESREAAKGVNRHGGFFGHGLIRIFTDAAAFSAARAFQPEICPAASRGTPARPWGSPAVVVSHAKPRSEPHRHFDLCSLFCVHWASRGRQSVGAARGCCFEACHDTPHTQATNSRQRRAVSAPCVLGCTHSGFSGDCATA